MKISLIVKELQHILETKGDMECTISCSLSDDMIKELQAKGQRYVISTPGFVVVEGSKPPVPGQTEEVMIRDWPY